MTYQKMFGIYLHSLVHHAPYLRSANTGHEERLFRQANDLVHSTTNRQPHTVIPNVLLRLQAKHKAGQIFKTFNKESGRISNAASELQALQGNTVVAIDFLVGRISS